MRWLHFSILLLLAALAGCKPSSETITDAKTSASPPAPPPQPYLLHLPGVSGESIVDHTLVQGFREGGLDAQIEIYDWTEHDTGVPALQAIERNKKQAKKIADMIEARFRADPRITIYLTSHSGGAGPMAWALENLPPEVTVRRALFLAPALSPGYDLSKALGHVADKAYVFHSNQDTVVLSVGTKVFGTIDGVYSEAAGFSGFVMPAGADVKQYSKLVQMPYDPAWARFGHYGDHIGVTTTDFSREVLVPLIQGNAATTHPAHGGSHE
jgi:hypothetical protein